MRWLVIQSDGVHKGQDDWAPNWFLRECYSLQDALRRSGHEADVWGLRHANYAQTPDFNSYDAVILAENYEMDWLPDFSKMWRPLRIQWIIDLHWQPWEVYYPWSQHMDIVMHATLSSIEPYERQVPKPKHVWFPNAVDDRYFNLEIPYSTGNRPTDVVFIGGKGAPREKTIDRMVAEVGMFYGYGITGHDYINALRKAKIGFNKNLAGDLNYRTFETIACGGCLVTQRDWALEKLGFVDGHNCVLYESDDEAVSQTKELLASGKWADIGYAGHVLSAKHSYAERIKLLLNHL